MKLSLPSPVLLTCLALAVPPMSSVSYPQTRNAQTQTSITERNVLAIVNSMDKATKNRNMAGIMAPLARDVKIKLIIATGGKEQELNLDRAQYAYYTRRALRAATAYQFAHKNVIVKISDDGTMATFSDDIYETITFPQGSLRSVTAETITFNLRDGKIVITPLEGRTRPY